MFKSRPLFFMLVACGLLFPVRTGFAADIRLAGPSAIWRDLAVVTNSLCRSFYLLCLMPLVAFAGERDEVSRLVLTASTNQGDSYLTSRSAIVALGTNALPILGRLGTDGLIPWEQRLLARICYERIERGHDIEVVRGQDWRGHPGYDRRWAGSMTGPGWRMSSVVVPYLAKQGLWYYYIEITWKQTGEMAVSPLQRINERWPRWCRMALCGMPDDKSDVSPAMRARLGRYPSIVISPQPEAYFLWLAMGDRLANDPALRSPGAVELYRELVKSRQPQVVPVLVSRYAAYDRHLEAEHGVFADVLSFADSSQANFLDAFVVSNVDLSPLRQRISDVRDRPVHVTESAPPFRLGTNLVMLAR